MAYSSISQELLKRCGLRLSKGVAYYSMVFDSNQELTKKDPRTGKIIYQEVELDFNTTLDYYKRGRLKPIIFEESDSVCTKTASSSGCNLSNFTFFNPNVVPILMSQDLSSQLLKTEVVDVFSTPKRTFQFQEPYIMLRENNAYNSADNYNSDLKAGVDYKITIEQCRFERSMCYSDIEFESAAFGGLDLIANKQEALAHTFAKIHEQINLYGVKGRATYGFLNYPYYPSSLNAKAVKLASGTMSSRWEDKFSDIQSGANFIANDVLELFRSICILTKNAVSTSNSFILAVSSKDAVYLESCNNYGVRCLDIIKKSLPNLEVVVVPQLNETRSGRKIYLYPTKIKNKDIGMFALSEKMTLGSLIDKSKYKLQNARAGTWGCIIRYPEAVGTMIVS